MQQLYEDLKSYRVENYKSISDSGNIEPQGLNVLIGPNSSGKTNILESLLLLKQTFENDEVSDKLSINGDWLNLGNFKNIIRDKNLDREVRFAFSFEKDVSGSKEITCPFCSKDYKTETWYEKHLNKEHASKAEEGIKNVDKYQAHKNKETTLIFEFGWNRETESIHITEVKINNPVNASGIFLKQLRLSQSPENLEIYAEDAITDSSYEIQLEKSSEVNLLELNDFTSILRAILREFREEESPSTHYWYWYNSAESHDRSNFFKEKKSQKIDITDSVFKGNGGESKDTVEEFLKRITPIFERTEDLSSKIESFLDNLSHVGPLRKTPQRIYSQNYGVGDPRENEAVDRLVFQNDSESELLRKTNDWLKETGFDCELKTEETELRDFYRIKVKENDIEVNLADVGFGLSQTLPIITECISLESKLKSSHSNSVGAKPQVFLRQTETAEYTAIIEEPEIHLNPRIEAELGDFFIKSIDSGINLLIETHSEHLINRLQRRVADGTIDRSNVNIIFVEKQDHITDLREIKMDENGRFSNWPGDFFQDDYKESIEILKESMSSEGQN